jgi:hypothetical protein
LIYLDRRENTFCIPLNRSASLLAGLAASYGIAFLVGERPPNAGELIGAALIALAILALSPLHHMKLRLSHFEQVLSRTPGPSAGGLAPESRVEPQIYPDLAAVPMIADRVGESRSIKAPER